MTAGQPLDGVRILALEQMQAMPFATQLLGRLGADVVKVEHPADGDLGRGSLPAMTDPEGRRVGATFLRNNLGKRSVAIDLSDPTPDASSCCASRRDSTWSRENFKGARSAGLGLGYDDVAAVHPAVVYVSISGFGNTSCRSPYDGWPAYAGVAEAMSGLYEWKRRAGEPPRRSPLGRARRHRHRRVRRRSACSRRCASANAPVVGQHVDVAMFDAMVAFADVVTNFWSMGDRPTGGRGPEIILDGFEAGDGWFIVQVGREHEFERLAKLVGRPEWLDDDRLRTRAGWRSEHRRDPRRRRTRGRPTSRTSQACHALAAAGDRGRAVLDRGSR